MMARLHEAAAVADEMEAMGAQTLQLRHGQTQALPTTENKFVVNISNWNLAIVEFRDCWVRNP